jgi:hypothetical protein
MPPCQRWRRPSTSTSHWCTDNRAHRQSLADYVVASCHLGRGAQGGARHPAHVTRQPRGADVGLGLFCGPELADRIGVEVGPCTPPAFSVATTALRGRTVHVVDAGIGSRTADGVEPANPEGHGALAARMEAHVLGGESCAPADSLGDTSVHAGKRGRSSAGFLLVVRLPVIRLPGVIRGVPVFVGTCSVHIDPRKNDTVR